METKKKTDEAVEVVFHDISLAQFHMFQEQECGKWVSKKWVGDN